MATTATISISSDIYPAFSGISKSMTFTKAGTSNDIEETTDISGMINSKDLLLELKDVYNELKKRELERTFPPNLNK